MPIRRVRDVLARLGVDAGVARAPAAALIAVLDTPYGVLERR